LHTLTLYVLHYIKQNQNIKLRNSQLNKFDEFYDILYMK
jgi:hypothetical protein